MLDRLARRYHTDPMTVLGWEPERIALAKLCMDAGEDAIAARCERMRGGPMAVLDVGR